MTTTDDRVSEALRSLERQGRQRVRDDMRTRYGIVTPKAFGVPMSAIQQLDATVSGPSHVIYEGDPVVNKTVNGPGSVERKATEGS